MAKLYFRYGAMNSGKTLDLIKTDYNYKERKMNTIILKATIDKKGNDNIISRVGFKRKVDFLIDADTLVKDIVVGYLEKKTIDCILVDEAQFFTTAQINDLSDIADFYDIPIICYGLRADFRGELFPGSKRLFEIADSIEEIKTICRCGKKATFNTRKINNEFVFDGEQVAIDGVDAEYESLCRKCYKEEQAKIKRRIKN